MFIAKKQCLTDHALWRSSELGAHNILTLTLPQVVIFDKDGTLVCFHTMWNSWCEQLAHRMTLDTRRDQEDEVRFLLPLPFLLLILSLLRCTG